MSYLLSSELIKYAVAAQCGYRLDLDAAQSVIVLEELDPGLAHAGAAGFAARTTNRGCFGNKRPYTSNSSLKYTEKFSKNIPQS